MKKAKKKKQTPKRDTTTKFRCFAPSPLNCHFVVVVISNKNKYKLKKTLLRAFVVVLVVNFCFYSFCLFIRFFHFDTQMYSNCNKLSVTSDFQMITIYILFI